MLLIRRLFPRGWEALNIPDIPGFLKKRWLFPGSEKGGFRPVLRAFRV